MHIGTNLTGETINISTKRWVSSGREDYPYKAEIIFPVDSYNIVTLLNPNLSDTIRYVLNEEDKKYYIYASALPTTEVEFILKIEM